MADEGIVAGALRRLAPQRRPDVVALARVASVAAVVEPALLRRLRLEVPGLAPQGGRLDAGTEADLWFSRLVHVATARQLTLRPAVAKILRRQLGEPQHSAAARAARTIVADAHRNHPDMLQLEERIIWSTIVGDTDDVGRAFDRALATIRLGPDRAAEVVRWAMQARRRLPAEALDTPVGHKLLAAVAMHADRTIPAELLAAERFPDSMGDVVPAGLPETTVAVELAEGGIRFVSSDQPNAALLTVPDTRPLILEARWTGADGKPRYAVIPAGPGSAAAFDGLAGPVVLRTITGRRFLVESVGVVPADEIRGAESAESFVGEGQPVASEAPAPSPSQAQASTAERPFPDRPEGTDSLSQIDHILVLMMAGHSYDNYLGMLRGRGDGFPLGSDGEPEAMNLTPDGGIQRAFRMPTTCQLPGQPSEEWEQAHVQFNDGRNDGFVRSASGPVAMGYWTGDDLPWAYSLAATFPLATRWFASCLGAAQPNRQFLLAATSGGMVDAVSPENLLPTSTIFDLLDDHQISWRNYYSSFPPTSDLALGSAIRSRSSVVPIAQFFTDAKMGNLPGFAIIDPDFGASSGASPQNIVHAEVFAASVVQAVMESPAWPRTLLVWTFSAGGGYYDHVPPPRAVAPDDIWPLPPATAHDGFARLGFRVPAVVVSPWAKLGYVSSVVYDHTSILATVERKWNLPPLTRRDAAAADLSDFLDLTGSPAFLVPPPLVPPLAGPAQIACEKEGPGQIPPAGSVAYS